MLKGSLGLIALSSRFLSGAATAQEKIKVGVTATLEGAYTVLGEDGIRGFQTALNTLGKEVGDKELEFVIASTDATPNSAVRAVRKLIEQDKVQILLSPSLFARGAPLHRYQRRSLRADRPDHRPGRSDPRRAQRPPTSRLGWLSLLWRPPGLPQTALLTQRGSWLGPANVGKCPFLA
jgi:hypothetical protein